MICRDKLANADNVASTQNMFSICINIESILNEMKKEGLTDLNMLSEIENKLFYFYQNLRSGKSLTTDPSENTLHMLNEEFDHFLTFKFNLGTKAFSQDKLESNLGYFLKLIPQYLSGNEFADPSDVDFAKSPRGQINAIIAYNFNSKSYITYVDVDCIWTVFYNKQVKQLHFFENVVEHLLKKCNVPIILLYSKCACPIQRNNEQISEMLKDYITFIKSNKPKEDFKGIPKEGAPAEDTKEQYSLATSTENKIDKHYKQRKGKMSMTEISDKSKKKHSKSMAKNF